MGVRTCIVNKAERSEFKHAWACMGVRTRIQGSIVTRSVSVRLALVQICDSVHRAKEARKNQVLGPHDAVDGLLGRVANRAHGEALGFRPVLALKALCLPFDMHRHLQTCACQRRCCCQMAPRLARSLRSGTAAVHLCMLLRIIGRSPGTSRRLGALVVAQRGPHAHLSACFAM